MPLHLLQHLGAVAALAALAACAGTGAAPENPAAVSVAAAEPELVWRGIAREEDERRIDDVAGAWKAALAEAGRSRAFRGLLEDEGELLDPAVALPRPAPPPGPYFCRVTKLGNGEGRGPPFVSYQPFFCYVEAEGELLTIVKQTGSERPAGRIYPDSDETRLIFLGTLALGNEEEPLAYGDDPKRDMAGIVERVGPFRYRLVIPYPRHDSTMDVFELVPVTESAKVPSRARKGRRG